MIEKPKIQIMSHIVIRDADSMEILLRQRDAMAKLFTPKATVEATTEPVEQNEETKND